MDYYLQIEGAEIQFIILMYKNIEIYDRTSGTIYKHDCIYNTYIYSCKCVNTHWYIRVTSVIYEISIKLLQSK